MRFGVHIPAYGRHALLELVIEQLHACRRMGTYLTIAVAGEEDDADAAMAADMFSVVENWPLTEKFNASCQMLVDQPVDAAVVLGSDDLVTPGYFSMLEYQLLRGMDYIATRNCWAYDVATRRLHHWPGTRLGTVDAGRCLSRKALDALGWEPWEYSEEMTGMGSFQEAGIVRRAHWIYQQGTYEVWDMEYPWRVGIKTQDRVITRPDRLGMPVLQGRELLRDWYGARMVRAVECC